MMAIGRTACRGDQWCHLVGLVTYGRPRLVERISAPDGSLDVESFNGFTGIDGR